MALVRGKGKPVPAARKGPEVTRKKPLTVARAPTETERLDVLSKMPGFVCSTCDGLPAYRIMGRMTWHPTLRDAIDEIISPTTAERIK
jgi:hypothetical protein